ncbi:MAG: DNA double-strand break repair nuclease NurA [Methanothermobacter sp.]|nr:DNA double-strand break repair nuclease NurA [Methanothermobacter sp.]
MGVVEKIIKALEEDVNRGLGKPYIQSRDYKVYDFNKDNFKPLKDVEPRLMAFVDGGNNTILEAPTFSLQINRVYFNLFKGKERQRPFSGMPEKIEFLSYLNVHESEDKQIGKVKIFPLSEEDRKYLPKNLKVTLPGPPDFYQRSRMFSVARRFAEWSLSTHIVKKELDDGDILVKDGSLQASFERENEYLNKVMKTAYKMGVNFAGLSKTSTLSTNTGNSLIASIKKFAEYNDYDRWCYYPIAEEKVKSEHPGSIIMAVKLHKLTDYIFRMDLLKTGHDEVEVVSAISENTVDPTFPGYPYGLIDADLNARVRMDEVKLYRTRILSALSDDLLEELKSHIRALDAHERLNMIANIIKD